MKKLKPGLLGCRALECFALITHILQRLFTVCSCPVGTVQPYESNLLTRARSEDKSLRALNFCGTVKARVSQPYLKAAEYDACIDLVDLRMIAD